MCCKSCCFTSKNQMHWRVLPTIFLLKLVFRRIYLKITRPLQYRHLLGNIISPQSVTIFLSKRSASLELLVILFPNFFQSFFTLLHSFIDIFALRDLRIFHLSYNDFFLALIFIYILYTLIIPYHQ